MRKSRFKSSNRMPILLYLIGLHFCIFHVPHSPRVRRRTKSKMPQSVRCWHRAEGIGPKAHRLCSCEQRSPTPLAVHLQLAAGMSRFHPCGILSFLCEITLRLRGKTEIWMARSFALPFGHNFEGFRLSKMIIAYFGRFTSHFS